MNLTELNLATKSTINSASFTSRNVSVTPAKCFDLFYEDGVPTCNVLNWCRENDCHVVDILSLAIVDGKPLYIIETVEVVDSARLGYTLSSRSFKTIKEVKAAI